MLLHLLFSLFKFSLSLIVCLSCCMEHVGACSLRGSLTSVKILLTEGKSYTYLYGQIVKLDDIIRFDPFLSFSFPNVGLQMLGRVGNLETSVGISYRVKLWINLLNCVDPESTAAVRSVTRSGVSNCCTEVLLDCCALSNRCMIWKPINFAHPNGR